MTTTATTIKPPPVPNAKVYKKYRELLLSYFSTHSWDIAYCYYNNLCLSCGNIQPGELDVSKAKCKSCGEHTVYGIESLIYTLPTLPSRKKKKKQDHE